MTENTKRPSNPYPPGFVFGQGTASPYACSLSGLKLSRALRALRGISGQVMEIGCGGGQYLGAVRKFRPDLKLFGVDIDPRAVACAEQISGVECVLADAQTLPFSAKSFEAILSFDLLEHTARPEQVLAECSRVLKDRGLLHMYVPCEGNPGTVYQRKGHENKARFGGHVQCLSTRWLTRALEKNGFRIVHLRHADYWFTQQLDYMFYRMLARSQDPRAWWAAQSLRAGGGWKGWGLRCLRRGLSVLSWLEGSLRLGSRGAMGVHVTAWKDNIA